jgi:YidC/Oxa1 family membrane protein insertase
MNFRTVLTLVVVGFLVLCGWLCFEIRNFQPCILLQQTAVDERSDTADTPVLRNERMEAADIAGFGAEHAQARTVILGAADTKTEDHETGFKFQLELSSKGAAIRKATFSNGLHNGRRSGFDDRDYKDPQPLIILSPVNSRVFSMANTDFIFVQHQLKLRLNELHWKSFDVERDYDGSQTARFEAVIKDKETGEAVVKLTKTYRVVPGSYLLECNLTVENLSASEQGVRFDLGGPVGIGREAVRTDMRKVVGAFVTASEEIVSSSKGIQSSFLSRKTGLKQATQQYEEALRGSDKERIKLAKEKLRIAHKQELYFLWAATTNKYFAAILRPVPDAGKEYCDWVADKTGWFYNPDGDERGDTGDETVGVALETRSCTLAAKGDADSTRQYNLQLYLGPKDKSLFDKNEDYKKLGFVHTIDFMPCCCCPAGIIRPLAFGILALMKWMYSFFGNYGVVIIILVFLFRLAIHPLTKKSQVSMSKFSKIAPKVEQIRKKYANNKAEMNKQVMQLYREQGASPIMGMLPMMVQMPIWIALWSAVYASIELRGAPFLPFWITDLSVPDALVRFATITVPLLRWKIESLNLLPLLMGVAFYLQQKLMPKQAAAAANPQVAQQQKMMMIMFPLLFPLMLYKAPSGVNLYIMASTFAGVIEQHLIRKHIREKEEAESKGLVAATSKTGGKVKKKKPKPFIKM